MVPTPPMVPPAPYEPYAPERGEPDQDAPAPEAGSPSPWARPAGDA
jgi:hypothetical protein